MAKLPTTPKEKIAYLAEFMGFEVLPQGKEAEEWTDNVLVKYPDGHVTQHWNPLKDWNHWRQVEERALRNEILFAKYAIRFVKENGGTLELAMLTWRMANADLPEKTDAMISAIESNK